MERSLTIISVSSEKTEEIGHIIGQRLKGGEVIELASDVGGGKTTFVRGLSRGAGSMDIVASPTFTIGKQYKTEDVTIYHFDFYRLSDAGLIRHELVDAIDDPKGVIVVEWSQIIKDVLPVRRLTIDISKTRDDNREITITYNGDLTYLVKDLK